MDSNYPCGWQWAYAESPETFDAFAQAEDPDGLAVAALLKHSDWAEKRILEIGCGTGRWSVQLATARRAQEWVATEPSRKMLALAKQHDDTPASLMFHQAKAQAIALPDSTFDAIFAGWVLGYLKPTVFDEAIKEAQRLLKPGGHIWLFENGSTDGGIPQDARNIERLQNSGFELVESISTQLEFRDSAMGQQTLNALFAPHATPVVDKNGQVAHTICLWRL